MYGLPAGAAVRLWWGLHRPRGPLLLLTVLLTVLSLMDAAGWWLYLGLGGIVLIGFVDETSAGVYGLTRRDALVGGLLGHLAGALVAAFYAGLITLVGGRVLTYGADADAWASWGRTALIVIGLVTSVCAALLVHSVRKQGVDHATSRMAAPADVGHSGPRGRTAGRGVGLRAIGLGGWADLWPDTAGDRAVRAPLSGTIMGSWLLVMGLLSVVTLLRIPWPQIDLAAVRSALFAMMIMAMTTGTLAIGGSFTTWLALQGSRARWTGLALPVVLASGAAAGALALVPIGLA